MKNSEQDRRTVRNDLPTLHPDFPEGKYDIIYCDPPWDYGDKMQFDKSGKKDVNSESKPYTLREVWPITALISILLIVQIIFFIFDNQVDKFSISSYIFLICQAIILILFLYMPTYAKRRLKK